MSPEEKAGRSINFRVRGHYRDALEQAAKLAGRSLSEECEYRLDRSVDREAALVEMFGSPQHQGLLTAVGTVVRLTSAMCDGPENAPLQVRAAVIHLFEEMTGKKAAAIMDAASKTGLEWQTAARRVALLEKDVLQPTIPLSKIMSR